MLRRMASPSNDAPQHGPPWLFCNCTTTGPERASVSGKGRFGPSPLMRRLGFPAGPPLKRTLVRPWGVPLWSEYRQTTERGDELQHGAPDAEHAPPAGAIGCMTSCPAEYTHRE